MKLKRMWGVTIVTLACFVAVGAAAKSKESGTMVLHSDAVIAGSHLATGRYDVQWETNTPEATVSFLKENKVVATATGKVVDRGRKYQSDGVLFNDDASGPHAVLEIRFKGSSQVIVFNE